MKNSPRSIMYRLLRFFMIGISLCSGLSELVLNANPFDDHNMAELNKYIGQEFSRDRKVRIRRFLEVYQFFTKNHLKFAHQWCPFVNTNPDDKELYNKILQALPGACGKYFFSEYARLVTPFEFFLLLINSGQEFGIQAVYWMAEGIQTLAKTTGLRIPAPRIPAARLYDEPKPIIDHYTGKEITTMDELLLYIINLVKNNPGAGAAVGTIMSAETIHLIIDIFEEITAGIRGEKYDRKPLHIFR